MRCDPSQRRDAWNENNNKLSSSADLCDFPVFDQVYWEFKLKGTLQCFHWYIISNKHNGFTLHTSYFKMERVKGQNGYIDEIQRAGENGVTISLVSCEEKQENRSQSFYRFHSELISQDCKRRKNLCKSEIIFHSSYLFFCTHFSTTALHLHWWKSSRVTITPTGFIWLGFHLEKLSLPSVVNINTLAQYHFIYRRLLLEYLVSAASR